ncbi:glutaredoxin family protein [Staphylococcus felis]|uniref:Glutaredoxin family protein n=1 Tax=Staphylococcus felis TaxID=46127 RepID=A0ABS0QLL4_9STAP|nr:glutaredoxin family protein [Staphylococcus felis]AVP37447.1 glutaredoxin family protein [Staphylococcus felis]MBH9580102.1 glutaredoxin family protein [Staphylococcus felis]PNZ36245.1 thiol reductase thioredoxin [Staphylococcus felis]QQB02604.1 glutaredoxin family protein [Staphylococcus felis]REI09514.1 glutaredoxin family protein [Staphylococcus felis]
MKLVALKKPNCMPCGMVTRYLSGKLDGVDYEEYDVTTDSGMVVAGHYGIMSVPVLMLLDEHGAIAGRVDGYKEKQIDDILAEVRR